MTIDVLDIAKGCGHPHPQADEAFLLAFAAALLPQPATRAPLDIAAVTKIQARHPQIDPNHTFWVIRATEFAHGITERSTNEAGAVAHAR